MVRQSAGSLSLQRRKLLGFWALAGLSAQLPGLAAASSAAPSRRSTLSAPSSVAGSLAYQTGQSTALSDQDQDVPFVVTPQSVVDAMLEMAQFKAGDRLIDLGCGDGRIVRTAAQRYRIHGLGVDLDPALVLRAQALATEQGLQAYCRFEVRDLYDTDLAAADVITLYLLPAVNLALRPRLMALRSGTRILSHDWDMGDWRPQEIRWVHAPDKPVGFDRRSKLMKWVIA
ncbi:MAG: class I SAM-dependent methyltransferase [Betaproteobacteria bacterium]|jgi:SAM-dependent methyltransferase|nr:methyltransferase domain-containing protein [Pseudomonadota bacterium]NBO04913.1 class I SAM-dependent methyltransferase [Betaproteobacteria bacterium]HAB47171.1 SAM-dependent methyltransferase [Lautropia sp.]NBO94617.1 class I SAM-dependent methyltransferase [Betaproteobacteria bacterium]NBP34334.1 class I SAM-dependent methyltransferase [Betaproteobacteria bacterium]